MVARKTSRAEPVDGGVIDGGAARRPTRGRPTPPRLTWVVLPGWRSSWAGVG